MTLDQAYKQVVPFGKYAGKTLLDVARLEIGYLCWLRDKATSPVLSHALAVVCDANTREIAEAEDARERHRTVHEFRKRGW